jgi:hypothetical protein
MFNDFEKTFNQVEHGRVSAYVAVRFLPELCLQESRKFFRADKLFREFHNGVQGQLFSKSRFSITANG